MSIRNIIHPNTGVDLGNFHKIKYRPVPVRETLIEMKDISELIIDLAYSSILLNNKSLAEEVTQLEERMDDLIYLLNMNLMLSARDAEDAEALSAVQRVGALTNSISDVAGDLARLVIHGVKIHPVAKEVFERTEEHLDHGTVIEGSTLIGKTVDELHLARKVGADIIALKRGEHWLLNPGKEIITPEDMIVARGTQEGLIILLKVAKGELDVLE
jgi:uncharacterized protein with PhoU and TrkA domain